MKLEAAEIKILGEYKFIGDEFMRSQKNRNKNETLLCLRKNENGDWRLDKVQTKDATSWEIFKSYFGVGKLAGCTLSFEAIGNYLAERDISTVESDAPAYDTIHAIAGRMLIYHKRNQDLWKKLATQLKSFNIQQIVRERDIPISDKETDRIQKIANRTLLITPKSKIGHLVEQVNLLEGRDWAKPDDYIYSHSTEATKWGGWTETYQGWWDKLGYTQDVDEKNLSGLFFKVISRVDYPYVSMNSTSSIFYDPNSFALYPHSFA